MNPFRVAAGVLLVTLAAIGSFALGGCRQGELIVVPEEESEQTDVIVLPVDNCAGAGDIKSEASYDLRVNVQGSGNLGFDIGAVETNLGSSLGLQSGSVIRHTVQTPVCMEGEHRIEFIVDVTSGYVMNSRSGKRALFTVKAPRSVAGVVSDLVRCSNTACLEGDDGIPGAVDRPKEHAWRCDVEFTDRSAGDVIGAGELTFGRVTSGNEVDYGRLFLDHESMQSMERNMEAEVTAWGFMGARTDDTLTFVFPEYRFPGQPLMMLTVTKNTVDNRLELRGDLLLNKDDAGAIAYVDASCRAED